ncbi:MAG: hypothetical protein HYV20_03075 [Gemmatimonadetes bacterium]|nr:hypothetical protein [Gemmatimonadota bacterium]
MSLRVCLSRVIGSWLFLLPAGAWGQAPPPPQLRADITSLVQSGPSLLGTATPDERRRFVLKAAGLLQQLPDSTRGGTVVGSVEDAVRELENALAAFGQASAEVRSEPPGMTVRYWRAFDTREAAASVTTNATLRVRPAWYLFVCRDPATGRESEPERVDCTSRCTHVCSPLRQPGAMN